MTKGKRCGKIERNEQGALAQLGAHNTGSVGVRGSNPLRSTKKGPARYAARVLFWWFCFHGSNPLRHRKTESACNHVRCFRMGGKTEKWRNECAVEPRKKLQCLDRTFRFRIPRSDATPRGSFFGGSAFTVRTPSATEKPKARATMFDVFGCVGKPGNGGMNVRWNREKICGAWTAHFGSESPTLHKKILHFSLFPYPLSVSYFPKRRT